jgi:hypothetical protein
VQLLADRQLRPGARDAEAQPEHARNLFDTGSKSGKIGRAMKGRYVYKDDYLNSTKTFVWSLKPRR